VGLLRLLAPHNATRWIRSSHHILARPGIPELLNLQEVGGMAKPYQLRQLLRLVERYNLTIRDQP
jgi:hypothetical protein